MKKKNVSSNWPHGPAHPFCLTCVELLHPPSAISSSPCLAEASASSASFLQPLPIIPAKCRTLCPLPEGFLGASFVFKHLAVRNPTAMQFHCLHAKSINGRLSKVK